MKVAWQFIARTRLRKALSCKDGGNIRTNIFSTVPGRGACSFPQALHARLLKGRGKQSDISLLSKLRHALSVTVWGAILQHDD
jgi:hypothetical protein